MFACLFFIFRESFVKFMYVAVKQGITSYSCRKWRYLLFYGFLRVAGGAFLKPPKRAFTAFCRRAEVLLSTCKVCYRIP